MKINEIINLVNSKEGEEKLLNLYRDISIISKMKERYISILNEYKKQCKSDEGILISVPGRCEICGNHTDHQLGEVLCASISKDLVGVISKSDEIEFISKGFEPLKFKIDFSNIMNIKKGTNEALIMGILYRIKELGYNIGGFRAYLESNILVGSGLSSSAALEIFIGSIISLLYNDNNIDPVTLAQVGQYSENNFLGKPSGLMDQLGCAMGGISYINFKDNKKPIIKNIKLNLDEHEYSICITNTLGSHEDLTGDYKAITKEMKLIANYFNKNVLSEVIEEDFFENLKGLREKVSHRAILRAIHFFNETKRPELAIKAIECNNFKEFLNIISDSGNSSYKYLQNIYSPSNPEIQGISLGLCISEMILEEDEAFRVHGGGFAGTIIAFVKNKNVTKYKKAMDELFEKDSCEVLKIRDYGLNVF